MTDKRGPEVGSIAWTDLTVPDAEAIRGLGGEGRYCVIQDPAGAVAALYEID